MTKPWIIVGAFLVIGMSAAEIGHRLEETAKSGERHRPSLLRADTAPALPASGTQASAALPRSTDGHYWADASVNGYTLRFMVDTGATTVAIPTFLAQQAGIRTDTLNYDQNVTTANGMVKAAKITLNYVDIGGLRMNNVEALIANGGLDVPLLGMSYLSRLSRLEVTPQQMVLHL